MGRGQGRRARVDPDPTGPRAGPGQPVGSGPAGYRCLPLSPSRAPGPGGGGLDAREGRPLPFLGPLLPGAPSSCASPPAPLRQRRDLQAAALQLAARVVRGRPGGPATVGTEPGFQVAFFGVSDQGGEHLAGVHAAPAVDVQGERQGTQFLWFSLGGVERCVGSQIPGYHPGTASPSQRDLGLETTKKCSRETRNQIPR